MNKITSLKASSPHVSGPTGRGASRRGCQRDILNTDTVAAILENQEQRPTRPGTVAFRWAVVLRASASVALEPRERDLDRAPLVLVQPTPAVRVLLDEDSPHRLEAAPDHGVAEPELLGDPLLRLPAREMLGDLLDVLLGAWCSQPAPR